MSRKSSTNLWLNIVWSTLSNLVEDYHTSVLPELLKNLVETLGDPVYIGLDFE